MPIHIELTPLNALLRQPEFNDLASDVSASERLIKRGLMLW